MWCKLPLTHEICKIFLGNFFICTYFLILREGTKYTYMQLYFGDYLKVCIYKKRPSPQHTVQENHEIGPQSREKRKSSYCLRTHLPCIGLLYKHHSDNFMNQVSHLRSPISLWVCESVSAVVLI